jgi:hypothetical protein
MDKYALFKKLVIEEITKAALQLEQDFGLENIHGFALGTDDEVRTLFHSACTKEWVAQQQKAQEYEGIGYIFVEWSQSADEILFLDIGHLFAQETDADYASTAEWANARDKRFLALFDALLDIRQKNIFNKDTFLSAGSTDPCQHMEDIEVNETIKLNTPFNSQRYAKAMGHPLSN